MSTFVAEDNLLAPSISCHSFNWDRSMCAVSPNSNECVIYSNCKEQDMAKWNEAYRLSEHTMTISAIDWSPTTNKIVTCSHDRNAFVWTYDDEKGDWKQSLVILRINRAATYCKWSPDGSKFATASGSKAVPVCHFEEENDWWISKMIKKHKSTVLCVDWHPNNQVIVTGSCDFKCRVFSAFVFKVDKPDPNGIFGDLTDTFGELLAEFDAAHGWVTSVAWSPEGNRLAFSGHDSTVSFVHFFAGEDAEQPTVQTLKLKGLPVNNLLFCNNNKLIAAGHDMTPIIFDANGDTWSQGEIVDKKDGSEKKEKKKETNFSAARNMFGARVNRKSAKGGGKNSCKTKHKGAITDMNALSENGSEVKKIATSSVDGRMIFWDV
jgi:actin related protein 2/3 complex subunit 1A/1B